MSPLPDDSPRFSPGEAYRRCVDELSEANPDLQRAHVYATLSLEETLRDVVAQVAELAHQLTLASRRR